MAIALEVSIPIFSVGSGGLVSASCGLSQGQIDTTNTVRLEGVYTGSWPGNVNTWNYLEINTGGFQTGSWPGNINTWNQYQVLESGSNMGSYPGNNNNWDIYQVPVDAHNTDVIDNDKVNATQSSVLVEWNHFPFPPPETALPKDVRDMTRFKKAYSFQRQQPVRIRLYRK